MAAPTILNRGFISWEINTITEDFDWAVSGNPDDKSPKIAAITFVPGQADDKLVIKDGSATGPVFFYADCADTDEKVKYFYGARKWIYIDESECTLNSGHKVLIDLLPSGLT